MRLSVTPITRALTGALAIVAMAGSARAQAPFVALRDDGTLASTPLDDFEDADRIIDTLERGWLRSGAPMPEILSVWTTFSEPIGGTRALPFANDVTGIGLDAFFRPETFEPSRPPLRIALLHNDISGIDRFASRVGLPTSVGVAEYLFLLELSHLWGPAARIPGESPNALIGFPYHWSFFLDAGASVAGGNVWIDRGNGTFVTDTPPPTERLEYSWLDLYVMGLADRDEVAPFGVLEGAVVQGEPMDPIWRAPVGARTFPWWAETPVTVSATRRTVTVDDLVSAMGERAPAFGASPTRWTLGIVLVVEEGASDARIEEVRTAFAPIARALAPAFATATRGRGTLEVLGSSTTGAIDTRADETPDAGDEEPDAGAADASIAPDAGAPTLEAPSGCACRAGAGAAPRSAALALVALALALAHRRRR